jgi:ubiquinol oxidase
MFNRAKEPAPAIAIDYWRLPPDAKLLDVIYAVRSDETTHRFVNHRWARNIFITPCLLNQLSSLANLHVKTDVNPFAFREPDMHVKGKKLE